MNHGVFCLEGAQIWENPYLMNTFPDSPPAPTMLDMASQILPHRLSSRNWSWEARQPCD